MPDTPSLLEPQELYEKCSTCDGPVPAGDLICGPCEAAREEHVSKVIAVKDRFTVLELELAPWGYDDDDLGAALQSGAVRDLDFWKEIGASPERKPGAKGAARPAKSAPPKKRTKAKGFAKKR